MKIYVLFYKDKERINNQDELGSEYLFRKEIHIEILLVSGWAI